MNTVKNDREAFVSLIKIAVRRWNTASLKELQIPDEAIENAIADLEDSKRSFSQIVNDIRRDVIASEFRRAGYDA
ncbi:hypothetical protein [Parendozoicomonas haliclonae]|uniref:Uncharacterized protein n=1 Tax=Parendozoicomonas haliclonae TaxID=1960125 RepID=A0A1X7AL87_9GAMM|nr:hypothetical protein [Parendozoicomonas haliclonae]SMA45543.1 hypothetical protein EHSB41UT_01945 [Parendozoicomonas haliclonae]